MCNRYWDLSVTHEHRGVWNHRWFDCLLSCLSRLIAKKISKPYIAGGFPSQRSVIPEVCHEVILLIIVNHYNDVTMSVMASQVTRFTIVYLTVYSMLKIKNINAPRRWPLCGEFTGDRWISRTKGQWRGKYFHFMTSSCATWLQTGSRQEAID